MPVNLLRSVEEPLTQSESTLLAFLRKTIKGVIGFFGVFVIFPIIIAYDCFHDDEWVWKKIEIED